MKTGTIIEGADGRFAKLVEIKGSRFGLSAWVVKRAIAEELDEVTVFLNSFGLKQVMKEVDAKAPKAAKPVDAKAPKAE